MIWHKLRTTVLILCVYVHIYSTPDINTDAVSTMACMFCQITRTVYPAHASLLDIASTIIFVRIAYANTVSVAHYHRTRM